MENVRFLERQCRIWQVCNSIKKIIPHFQREEPVYIGARQGHSREPGHVDVSRRKIEKRYATLLYHIGFSKNEDSLKHGGLLPGGFGTSRCRKDSASSLVSSVDPNPDPKHHLHMKNHHDRLCEIDLETAQNSLEFCQTTNGSVLCATTQFRLSSSHKSSTSKTDQKSSEKKKKKRSRLPRKGVDATKGSRGKTHDITKTRNIWTLTAERNHWHSEDHGRKQKAATSMFNVMIVVLQMWIGGLTARQEKNAWVTAEKSCQIIQSLVQLRITEQLRKMRDHFRRCTRKGVADPITKQFFEGCVDRWENYEGYKNQMFTKRTFKRGTR